STAVRWLSYAAPSIDLLLGCNEVASSQLERQNCSRRGGDSLFISGDNFGKADALVLVGLNSCENVVQTHTTISCTMPPGNTLKSPILVLQSNGAISSSQALISYAQCVPGTYEIGYECLSCPVGTFTDSNSLQSWYCVCLICSPRARRAVACASFHIRW